MLTSYLVRCPHPGCDWFGSLLPAVPSWQEPRQPQGIVNFECPQCHGEWHARLVGDDVEVLPLEELASPMI